MFSSFERRSSIGSVGGPVLSGDEDCAKTAPAPLGPLLEETLKESYSSLMPNFKFLRRKLAHPKYNALYLLEIVIEQNAPLQEILMNLSMDYERLNDLMNKRESELQGRGLLIVLFVCIGLPGLIGFLVTVYTCIIRSN